MEHVEIDMPFFYSVGYVPPGKRKPVDATVSSTVKVSIPNITSAEAPKLVAWSDESYGIRRAQVVHRHGEDFYGYNPDEVLRIQDVRPKDLFNYERGLVDYSGNPVERPEPEGQIAYVEGISFEEMWPEAISRAAQEVVDGVKDYVFIDGVLCHKTALPKIMCEITYGFRRGDEIKVSIAEFIPEHKKFGAHGMLFSIGDMESALGYANKRAQIEAPGAEVRREVNVEVFDPELGSDIDLLKKEVRRIMDFVFTNAKFEFSEMSDVFIEQWMACRRAIRLMNENPEHAEHYNDAIAQFDTLMTIYETDERERRARYDSSYNIVRDSINYRQFLAMRDAWENRPIPISDLGFPSR